MPDLTWYVIYKTTHVETDQFYVGRHQTTDLNDGYQGSGKWVKSFEDCSVLVTEVIEYCEDADHVRDREQYYIDLWFDDPLCMNESRSSDGGQSVPHSIEWREAQSAGQYRRFSDPSARAEQAAKWTEEKCKEMSNSLIEYWSDIKLRKARSRAYSEYYILKNISTGIEIPVHGLRKWTRENGYHQGALAAIARGERKSHKGLTCRKVTKEEYQQLVDQLADQGNSSP